MAMLDGWILVTSGARPQGGKAGIGVGATGQLSRHRGAQQVGTGLAPAGGAQRVGTSLAPAGTDPHLMRHQADMVSHQ